MPDIVCDYYKQTSYVYFPNSEDIKDSSVIIIEGDSCETFNPDVTEILFEQNSCSGDEVYEFYMSGYPSLKRIVIKDNTFKNVYSATFKDMDNLIYISFGKDSFTGNYSNTQIYANNSILTITNCTSLTNLLFEERSFLSFRHFNITGIFPFIF